MNPASSSNGHGGDEKGGNRKSQPTLWGYGEKGKKTTTKSNADNEKLSSSARLRNWITRTGGPKAGTASGTGGPNGGRKVRSSSSNGSSGNGGGNEIISLLDDDTEDAAIDRAIPASLLDSTGSRAAKRQRLRPVAGTRPSPSGVDDSFSSAAGASGGGSGGGDGGVISLLSDSESDDNNTTAGSSGTAAAALSAAGHNASGVSNESFGVAGEAGKMDVDSDNGILNDNDFATSDTEDAAIERAVKASLAEITDSGKNGSPGSAGGGKMDVNNSDDEVVEVAPTALMLEQMEVDAATDNNAAGRKTTGEDSDDEVETSGMSNIPLLPHARHDCTHHSFVVDVLHKKTVGQTQAARDGFENNKKACEMCYCFICDVPAKDCKSWDGDGAELTAETAHCLASNEGVDAGRWTRLRDEKKRGASTNPAADSRMTRSSTSESNKPSEPRSMKIKELKRELESHGVNTSQFIEKSDLEDALIDVRAQSKSAAMFSGAAPSAKDARGVGGGSGGSGSIELEPSSSLAAAGGAAMDRYPSVAGSTSSSISTSSSTSTTARPSTGTAVPSIAGASATANLQQQYFSSTSPPGILTEAERKRCSAEEVLEHSHQRCAHIFHNQIVPGMSEIAFDLPSPEEIQATNTGQNDVLRNVIVESDQWKRMQSKCDRLEESSLYTKSLVAPDSHASSLDDILVSFTGSFAPNKIRELYEHRLLTLHPQGHKHAGRPKARCWMCPIKLVSDQLERFGLSPDMALALANKHVMVKNRCPVPAVSSLHSNKTTRHVFEELCDRFDADMKSIYEMIDGVCPNNQLDVIFGLPSWDTTRSWILPAFLIQCCRLGHMQRYMINWASTKEWGALDSVIAIAARTIVLAYPDLHSRLTEFPLCRPELRIKHVPRLTTEDGKSTRALRSGDTIALEDGDEFTIDVNPKDLFDDDDEYSYDRALGLSQIAHHRAKPTVIVFSDGATLLMRSRDDAAAVVGCQPRMVVSHIERRVQVISVGSQDVSRYLPDTSDTPPTLEELLEAVKAKSPNVEFFLFGLSVCRRLSDDERLEGSICVDVQVRDLNVEEAESILTRSLKFESVSSASKLIPDANKRPADSQYGQGLAAGTLASLAASNAAQMDQIVVSSPDGTPLALLESSLLASEVLSWNKGDFVKKSIDRNGGLLRGNCATPGCYTYKFEDLSDDNKEAALKLHVIKRSDAGIEDDAANLRSTKGKNFTYVAEALKVLNTYITEKQPPAVCPGCNASFPSTRLLGHHKRTCKKWKQLEKNG